jgi:hypothetical protein
MTQIDGDARASTGLHHPWFSMPTTPEDFRTYLAERWAITREMTGFPPVDPHPTLLAR